MEDAGNCQQEKETKIWKVQKSGKGINSSKYKSMVSRDKDNNEIFHTLGTMNRFLILDIDHGHTDMVECQ